MAALIKATLVAPHDSQSGKQCRRAETSVFRFTGHASPFVIRNVLERLGRFTDTTNLCAGDVTNIQIVVAEILNNISEHAYQNRGIGEFSVRMFITPQHVHSGFCDAGSCVPACVLEPRAEAEQRIDHDDLPEGGFGWTLIHTLATALRHRYIGGKNWLTVSIPRTRI